VRWRDASRLARSCRLAPWHVDRRARSVGWTACDRQCRSTPVQPRKRRSSSSIPRRLAWSLLRDLLNTARRLGCPWAKTATIPWSS